MNIEYVMYPGAKPKQTTLAEFIKAEVAKTHREGTVEQVESQLENLTNFVADLAEHLVASRAVTLTQITIALNSYETLRSID